MDARLIAVALLCLASVVSATTTNCVQCAPANTAASPFNEGTEDADKQKVAKACDNPDAAEACPAGKTFVCAKFTKDSKDYRGCFLKSKCDAITGATISGTKSTKTGYDLNSNTGAIEFTTSECGSSTSGSGSSGSGSSGSGSGSSSSANTVASFFSIVMATIMARFYQ